MKKLNLFFILLLTSSAWAFSPDCTKPDQWPASMALVNLNNANITKTENIDSTKTKVVRIASEKIGKDSYRQIHQISFTEKNGKVLEVITSNDATKDECSASGVTVYLVSKQFEP